MRDWLERAALTLGKGHGVDVEHSLCLSTFVWPRSLAL